MVDVNTQNKTISVNVSSSGVSSNVNASGDTSHYYSEKAREWAISNRIVDGVDYSSKYYANKSNQSALNAQSFAQSAQDSYNNFQQSVDGALSNINGAVQGGIEEINNTKTDIITDIEFVADGEKKEIEDLVDTGKDELKEAIGDIKVLTTLEIGDIGIAPLGIDETKGKRRYLNGQLIIQEQYVQFTNKVKSAISLYPSLACTESEWQTTATMTVGGQVGKFVVDDEAGTIRLPKIIMPIQGLTDLSKLGKIVEAGLPNITGKTGNINIDGYANNFSGALYGSDLNGKSSSGSGNFGTRINIDASRSSKVYGNSNTVQQEQIQYPYFIQVATGAETEDNIINEIELNNPFSLLDYKYSEYELNNLSWLRSNGQYNSKITYPAVYDLLLKIYNGTETKAGVSVKLSTDTSATDYDFRINTADETFMLPIKVKIKPLNGNIPVTTSLKINDIFPVASAIKVRTLKGDGVGISGLQITNDGYVIRGDQTLGTNQMPVTFANLVADGNLADTTDLYLYFYVGETVQNANLINAGRIEEKVASLGGEIASLIPDNKSLISSYALPSNKYIDLTLGASGTTYTAPANGWFLLDKGQTGNQYIMMGNDTFVLNSATSATYSCVCLYPAKKGTNVTVNYTASGQVFKFRFIYAEGEV